MKYRDISGAWLSRGKLVYIIIQLEDKFVWKVVHENGVTETGIGWFPEKESPLKVEAQWNFHGGKGKSVRPRKGKDIEPCKGTLVPEKNNTDKIIKIEWEDEDHFMKRIPKR